jgi:hypothetical protein
MTDYTITLAIYLATAIGIVIGYLYAPKPPTSITRKDWLPSRDTDGFAPVKESIGEFIVNALNPPDKNKPYLNPEKPQPWMGKRENR